MDYFENFSNEFYNLISWGSKNGEKETRLL